MDPDPALEKWTPMDPDSKIGMFKSGNFEINVSFISNISFGKN